MTDLAFVWLPVMKLGKDAFLLLIVKDVLDILNKNTYLLYKKFAKSKILIWIKTLVNADQIK